MPERIRARRGQEIVTVLRGKPGKRGKVEIRNSFGYRETINGKELVPVPEDEAEAKLRYAEAD